MLLIPPDRLSLEPGRHAVEHEIDDLLLALFDLGPGKDFVDVLSSLQSLLEWAGFVRGIQIPKGW